ncbi:MAG: spore germination protein [Candidatus Desulforudis sp.]|nr:spore germination protein [Desulforudis sp.]
MSLVRILSRLLVFREPEEPRYAFTAGREDRPRERGPGADAAGDKTNKLREGRRVDNLLEQDRPLSTSLDENERLLREIFRLPENKDLVLRPFAVGTEPPRRALLVFMDGPTDKTVQNLAILQPLMLLAGLRLERDLEGEGPVPGTGDETARKELLRRLRETLLPGNEVTMTDTFRDMASEVLAGNTVLFVDGLDSALSVETKGWATRGVGTPQVEAVIRGPHEAFTEQVRINVTLVRKILRRSSLVTDFVKVGQMSAYQCAVLYLDDIANPDLVAEVRRRLESIQADYVNESGLLEQFIEDSTTGLAPQVLATERPDRVAAGLVEGRVVILLDGNPWALIVPTTFFSMMHAAEDAYARWPFGSFARLVRYVGLALALLLPGSYIALVTYHQEFIPTDLLLAFTGAREQVPFPSVVEVLLMEIAFELIREAGIRIPGTVGTTLGIVGALILGQAAVAANIVSPILIVIVALTALGSFAIPNYPFSLSVRTLRFAYIALASFLGLFGIMVGLFVHLALLARLTSFGVPYFAPVAPVTLGAPDHLWRSPVWEQERRPDYVDPLRRRRQPRVSRGWVRAKKKDDERPGGR